MSVLCSTTIKFLSVDKKQSICLKKKQGKKLKTLLVALCFLSIMFGSGNAQLVVTSAENGDLIRVSRTGSMNITRDLTVKGLENTTGTESSLVGVDETGKLIKSDPSLLEGGLCFYPVQMKKILQSGGSNVIASDTLNPQLPLPEEPGFSIPEEATHILVEYFITFDARFPTTDGHYDANISLWLGQTDANDYQITTADVGTYLNMTDTYGNNEGTATGSTVVELTSSNTIAYYAPHNTSGTGSVDDVFRSSFIVLRVKGYFIPLLTLLQQQ